MRTRDRQRGRRGYGHVYQVPGRKVWRAQFYVNGKRKVIYASSEQEAHDKLDDLRQAAKKGGNIHSKETLGGCLASYVESKADWAPATRRHREGLLRLYVAPKAVASLSLLTLTNPGPLNEWIRELTADGVGIETQRQALKLVRAALRDRGDLVQITAASRVKLPKPQEREIVRLTDAQANAFIAAAKRELYGPIFRLALMTGCRMGELRGLRWDCVNLERGKEHLMIKQSLSSALKGEAVLRPTKTRGSKRPMELAENELALEALRDQQEELLAHGMRDAERFPFVFAVLDGERKGKPLRKEFLGRATLARILVAAGIQEAPADGKAPKKPILSFHALRHSNCSLLLENGVDLATVRDLAGHTKITTTNRYLRSVEDRRIAAGGRLSRAISAAGGRPLASSGAV